jgi:hypothetical protein
MSYLKLKKQNGAFDLVPCDNIIYVDGTEGAAESGAGALDGNSPFVQLVYGMPINSSDGLDLVATKVILGSNNQDVATTTAATTMQNAVNDAIVIAAQAEGKVVEVDFGGLLSDAGYVPIVANETFVASAGPTDYAFT